LQQNNNNLRKNDNMKKTFYLLSVFAIVVFTSCMEEKDNWYTNTKDYDGRYSVATTCEEYSDDDMAIEDGNELMIYNSAANVENQIIIDSHVAGFPIKGKFDVEGDISGFRATASTSNIASSASEVNDDEFYLVDDLGEPTAYPSSLGVPDKTGLEHKGMQLYSRLSLNEGKITPNGATTIGGNTSDAVYLAITTYCEFLTIESYQTDEDDWAVPGVPEFDWRVKAGSRSNVDGWEEHWKFDGYRYTGYPEDR
jgi:hypothetical protein